MRFSVLEMELALSLRDTSAVYAQVSCYSDTKELFASLVNSSDYRDVAQRICSHHMAHQKSKGSVSFIEEGELRGARQIRHAWGYGERCSAREIAARLAVISFQCRRDWHFQRAGLSRVFLSALAGYSRHADENLVFGDTDCRIPLLNSWRMKTIQRSACLQEKMLSLNKK